MNTIDAEQIADAVVAKLGDLFAGRFVPLSEKGWGKDFVRQMDSAPQVDFEFIDPEDPEAGVRIIDPEFEV